MLKVTVSCDYGGISAERARDLICSAYDLDVPFQDYTSSEITDMAADFYNYIVNGYNRPKWVKDVGD